MKNLKFAFVNGERQEAQPGLSGKCPGCDQPMIAKCGEERVWHWAHKGNRLCDPWSENETEWHRAWKGQFPDSWREIVHPTENGIKHIADVRTERGWVIEFQHSRIEPDERRSRDAFYPKLIWVVDGIRRKRDKEQFAGAFAEGALVGEGLALRRVLSDQCALLRDWAGSNAHVFFDFGDEQLWWLVAGHPGGRAYVGPFSRTVFITYHRNGVAQMATDFDELVNNLRGLVTDCESYLRAQALKQAPRQPLRAFEQYLGRRSRRQRRF
jgi:competence protein CoiA